MSTAAAACTESQSTPSCTDCRSGMGVPRAELSSAAIAVLCDACCNLRAVNCPFCDSPFGREVKRASRCKKCGETVARNSRSPFLATRLATPAICEALECFDQLDQPPIEQSWLCSCLLGCLLDAAKAGRKPQALDGAFAAALRSRFEKELTHDRLRCLGFSFARAIWLCGGNPRPIQRTLHRDHLEVLRGAGLTATVEILPAGDPCERCNALVGRTWTVEQALAENLLPCRDCLCVNEGGFGWCRCEYQQRMTGEYGQIQDEIDADIAEYFEQLATREATDARRTTIKPDHPKNSDSRPVKPPSAQFISVEESARIASGGCHYVRNRGQRGLNEGCDGAIAALREAGVIAAATPNRENPKFNDIAVTLSGGRVHVLRLCTSTFEFVIRPA